ncbi:rRNA maturation RNase YbeY [bacterium]|uniref:Endoribonuclease YbeY n=1 Tax=candidate division WOR-3 bacterium TaxID=2052148 RepID=A0A7C0ZDJ2_UNCW3|nr:MAG: rRNA maturation RNase YbeY [bacterium]HDI83711.1 rRNA maturation RNase YbeY [candidate division WOR-3 bacterium]
MKKIYLNVLPEYKDELEKKAKEVMKGEGLEGEVSITLVDDTFMEKLNFEYKGKKGTTDVIAFPFKEGEDSEFSGNLLGDIYISIEQASRQKVGSLLDELKLLVVHGLLHLAGYNDTTDEERKIMRKKEAEYL